MDGDEGRDRKRLDKARQLGILGVSAVAQMSNTSLQRQTHRHTLGVIETCIYKYISKERE